MAETLDQEIDDSMQFGGNYQPEVADFIGPSQHSAPSRWKRAMWDAGAIIGIPSIITILGLGCGHNTPLAPSNGATDDGRPKSGYVQPPKHFGQKDGVNNVGYGAPPDNGLAEIVQKIVQPMGINFGSDGRGQYIDFKGNKIYDNATDAERAAFAKTKGLMKPVAADQDNLQVIADDMANKLGMRWLPYDFDQNRRVDLEDFFAFALAFGLKKGQEKEGYNPRLDLNKNDAVDLEDFFAFALGFAKGGQRYMQGVKFSPTIGGVGEFEFPTVAGDTYTSGLYDANGNPLIGSDGNPISLQQRASKNAVAQDNRVSFDLSKMQGQRIYAGVVRTDKDGDDIEGRMEGMVAPVFYGDASLQKIQKDGEGWYQFTINIPKKTRVFAYVETEDRDDIKFRIEDNGITHIAGGTKRIQDRNGDRRLYRLDITDYVKEGTSTVKFREEVGRSFSVTYASSENIRLSR